MQELWGAVLQTSLYGSIVGMIILLSKIILKNNINAKYNYLIWLLLVIKLIFPFGPQSDISLFNKIPVNNVYETSIAYDETYTDNRDKNQLKEEPQEFYKGESTINKDYTVTQPQKPNILKQSLPIIWMIVSINIFAIFIISYYLLHRTLKKERQSVKEDKYQILNQCKNKMNIKLEVTLLVSDSVKTPSIVGLIKPKILLPSTIINLSDKELEYIFLHELSHYRRKDIIINYLLIILQSIHWFNPIIWYMFRKMREDMELATDEMVLKIINEDEHKDYGKTILSVLEKIKISKRNIGVIGMIEDKNTIKKRISMIKNMKLTKRKKLLFTIVGLTLIISLSGLLLTSAKENQEEDSMAYAKSLYEHRTQYIGNASNVVNLISKLPFSQYYESIELNTKEASNSLKVYYKFKEESQEEIKNQMYSNAVIIFSLIENVENIEFVISDNISYGLNYNRQEIDRQFHQAIYSKSYKLESLDKLITYLNQNNKGSVSLEEAISKALISSSVYMEGEVETEGHIILDKEEDSNIVKTYLITSIGQFGFENGIFTLASGTSCLPTVMTFEKDSNGNYKYIDRAEILDGAYYEESIKKVFPKRLWDDALNSNKYNEELTNQQEKQAKVYLKSINREAKVQGAYVEKKLADINANAASQLLQNPVLSSYPYWIGSREEVIDGVRFVYEKEYTKKNNEEFVIYTKKNEGKVVEQLKYKIVGKNAELVK